MILQQNNLTNFNFTHLEVKFMLGVNKKKCGIHRYYIDHGSSNYLNCERGCL